LQGKIEVIWKCWQKLSSGVASQRFSLRVWNLVGFPRDEPFLSVVLCPQSHRISSLFLYLKVDTYKDVFLLPPGLFDELVWVEIFAGWHSIPDVIPTATTPRLRRTTLSPHRGPPSALGLPWHQIMYLTLFRHPISLTASLEIMSLCTNLQECRLTLYSDNESPPNPFFAASIQLPHLRKLHIDVVDSRNPGQSLYIDYFRPLVLQNLEQIPLDLSNTYNGRLAELKQVIECLCLPDLRLKISHLGWQWPRYRYRARHIVFTSSDNKAPNRRLVKSSISLISQDPCPQ